MCFTVLSILKPISDSKWWSLSHVLHYDKTLGTFENTLTRNVFHISLVFSNVRRVLSQCNTQLRLFSLLNILIITDLLNIKKLSQSTSVSQLGALHQQHIYSNFLIHHSKFYHVNKILWLFNFSICRCWLEWQVILDNLQENMMRSHHLEKCDIHSQVVTSQWVIF